MRDRDDELLQRTFGLPGLRPHQRRSLAALREGRDVMVILSTGGGKSLCYQFPAVAGLAPAIVVSPLVALMKDQVDALVRRGIAAAQMSATLPERERQEAWRAYAERRLALLYLAPEALDNPATRDALTRTRPALLAIDEAHCISEWGESFRPAYLRLGEVRDVLGRPPTIALTATATGRTQRDIERRLGLRDVERIVSGFDRPNLSFEVERVADERARARRLEVLAKEAPGGAVFYASTRRGTEALAARLRRSGIHARGYHAGLPPGERAEVQDDFLAGRLPAIVATCAFGMGVDKPDVRLVVHAVPSLTLEAYYQEAGRAGRDGAPGRCVSLLAPNDIEAARRRLDRAVPGLLPLHRLYSLVRDESRRGRSVTDSTALIAAALALPPSSVAAARALLLRGGYITHAADHDVPLRILATPDRLASDRTLAPDDVAFVCRIAERLAAAANRRDGGVRVLTRRELAALETTLPLDERLRRVRAAQLVAWNEFPPPLRCAKGWCDEHVVQLRREEEGRVRRDLWRFEAVARFLTTSRCRRSVLLRYFADEAPQDWCGACDSCRASPRTGAIATGSPPTPNVSRRATAARSPLRN